MTSNKLKAVLLDLDDTLLINDMATFSPPYFRALMHKMQGVCPPGTFVEALNTGMRAMMLNDGRGPTNAEVFAREFFALVKGSREEIEELFDDFYLHEFEDLSGLTGQDPDARELVELVQSQGLRIAIATQPLFPLAAIRARLRWAGVSADEYDYDLITSYEVMSACKPRRPYFESVLATLGCTATEALMVGDSVESDMPAGRSGMATFLVDRGRAGQAGSVECSARGSLRDLISLFSTGEIHDLG